MRHNTIDAILIQWQDILQSQILIEGFGQVRALAFFGKNENRQNNSKFCMQVCLCVLNIFLHLFSLVFACFWRNNEENILLAELSSGPKGGRAEPHNYRARIEIEKTMRLSFHGHRS